MPDTQDPIAIWRWGLRNEFIGYLVTLITIVVSSVFYISKLEQRIALLEQSIQMQRDRDAAQDRTGEAILNQFRIQLDKIDTKLDHIVENRLNGIH